jgi:hypothetical protein
MSVHGTNADELLESRAASDPQIVAAGSGRASPAYYVT